MYFSPYPYVAVHRVEHNRICRDDFLMNTIADYIYMYVLLRKIKYLQLFLG